MDREGSGRITGSQGDAACRLTGWPLVVTVCIFFFTEETVLTVTFMVISVGSIGGSSRRRSSKNSDSSSRRRRKRQWSFYLELAGDSVPDRVIDKYSAAFYTEEALKS